MKLNELIANRQAFVDAQAKNGFDLTTILVGLYPDASHFVYEILQNAEDAKATKVSFELFEDKLVIKHDGIPFTDSDIEAITGISNIDNDKKKDLEKIGRFGIGFKSVYAVTQSPRIQSGAYDFTIINFVLPTNFSSNNTFSETIITLPFCHPSRTNTEIFELIKQKFESFEAFNVLFLNHVNVIHFIYDGKKASFRKEEKLERGSKIAFNSVVRAGKNKSEYLVFKTEAKSEAFSQLKHKPNIAIAFKKTSVDKQSEFIKADSSNMFAFFETGYETFLNFLLQAPFTTTPARDNIDFKLKINSELLDELGELIKKCLGYFREHKLISVNLLNQLPINREIEENKTVYNRLFLAVKDELLSGKKYLPSMFKNQYQAAQDLAIVRGRELTNIISRVEDLQMLFGVKYWMDTKITSDRTPLLLEYLTIELGIKEYTPEDFAKKLNDDFLNSKKDQWIQSFYEFLNGKQESLWRSGKGKDEGVLRRKSIIRLTNGKHTSPFDGDGKPKVFLPVSGQALQYDTISTRVIQSKASLAFIKDKLGIKKPDLFDNLKLHIVPLYQKDEVSVSLKDHLSHFQLILELYDSATPLLKSEIIKLFSNAETRFIRSENAKTGQVSYQNYQYVYLPTKELQQYFRFCDYIYFLESKKYNVLPKETLLSFLKECGVKDYAWRIQSDPKFSEDRLVQLRKQGNWGESKKTSWGGESITDYILEGLEEIISQKDLSEEDSLLIWKVLLNCIQNESTKHNFFKGTYNWFFRTPHSITFDNSILKTLRSTDWLYVPGSNGLKKPSEILVEELSKDYGTASEEAKILISNLSFKTKSEVQLMDQLPANKRESFSQFEAAQKLCEEKGIDLLSAINEIVTKANRAKENEELENAPDIDNVEPEEETFEGLDSSHFEPKQVDSNKNGDTDPKADGTPKVSNNLSAAMRNELGNRGERIVFQHLKKQWSKNAILKFENENEIHFDQNGIEYKLVLLNSESKKGHGCDILIKKEEETIKYIEVKSSKLLKKELFPVNGYQWALAYKMYKAGEGNKHYFYIVKDVLNKVPKITPIKNPIKKWKDGELFAHPVNLEF